MRTQQPSFTVGIEEEYLLVDRETRELVSEPPPSILQECSAVCGDQVSPEFYRSQLEVGTRVCQTAGEARSHLAELRQSVTDVVAQHGMAIIAASSHPFSVWLEQKYTPTERYTVLAHDLQSAVRRMVVGGMHIHVGIDDDDLRIDLMNQMSYFLPHFLALSCSSPFWEGQNTGLMSYRMTVIENLPRTGLPEKFRSYAEYQRHVDMLVYAGLIEDATKIWWDIRPSARYPTLESRITDICTSIDDSATIAALTICSLSMLYRLRRKNQRWRNYAPMLINENRWRAMRYSFDEGLVDFGRAEVVPMADLIEELIDAVSEDAERLGCMDELINARNILQRGTSAHRQVKVYDAAVADGSSHDNALRAVVDYLIEETKANL
ncbi:MAG: carboxylate-amine ligase [Pseudomonadales bacterium]